MKIAVTGASGLIGRELIKRLNDNGHEVIKFVRKESDASDAQHCWWAPERGILQLDKLHGLEACVHLAGRSIADARWTATEKELIRQSRIDATQLLCRDLLKLQRPLKCFVSASAVGIYGDCGAELVTETHRPGPADDFLVRTAFDWEQASAGLAGQGINVIHARFGVVLSPQGGALAKMLPLFRWGLGSPLGNGQQYWSWVTLNDTARALEWMLERSPQSPTVTAYNVVAPNPVTNAEFTRLLCQRLKRRPFINVPAFALRLMVGEMADAALLASCRAIPERLLTQGFAFESSSLDSALRQTVDRPS